MSNKISRIRYFCLSLMIMITIPIYAYDFEADGIYYNITSQSNLTVEVTYSSNEKYMGRVEIPEYVNYNDIKYIVTCIGNNAFGNCKELNEVTIPNTVISIGFQAFMSCSSLESIIIPNSVTTIGNGSFSYCENLKELKLSDSLLEIPQWAFGYCIRLIKVEIPNAVTKIGEYAFYFNTDLETVVIGETVDLIDNSAFVGCFKIAMITSLNPVPPSINNAFESSSMSVYNRAALFVPNDYIENYKTADYWKYFKNINSIAGIGDVIIDEQKPILYVIDNKIIIDNLKNRLVELYDINGKLIYMGNDEIIPINNAGFYIVRIADDVMKVRIRK